MLDPCPPHSTVARLACTTPCCLVPQHDDAHTALPPRPSRRRPRPRGRTAPHARAKAGRSPTSRPGTPGAETTPASRHPSTASPPCSS
eukprot:3497446-Prymnesium_polylepis.2